jgi:ABC-2 type transport system ATP-binding protein
LWDLVEELKRAGRTIILTTHYMEEAEQLCDRVAIMDHGKVIALGTPNELIAKECSEDIVEFAVSSQVLSAAAERLGAPALPPKRSLDGAPVLVDVEALKAIPGVQSHRVDEGVHQLSVSELHTTVPRIFAAIEAQGLHLSEFKTHSATLEDVFVRLTGRNLRDE